MDTLLIRVVRSLRHCDWLDGDRARAYTRILAGATVAVALAWIAVGAHGLDRRGEPIGGDFVSFWAASRLALEGRPELAYDVGSHWMAQKAMFGSDLGYAAFFYPPTALLLYFPLGLAPYFVSLLVWLGLSGYAVFRVARGFLPGLDAAMLMAFPAVLVNAAHGQTGFVTTALIGGGFLILDRRPAVAGLLFGMMAFKPHLVLFLPFALLFARRWTTVAAAATTGLSFCALSLLAFGFSTWTGFFRGFGLARQALEQNMIGYEKMQSFFAAMRLLHGSIGLAWAAQAASFVAALAALFHLHRRAVRPDAEAAVVVCANLLATPFLLDYDLTLLAIPLCWLLARGLRGGFLSFEKAALAAAFLLPLIARIEAGTLGLPLAPPLIATLMALSMRRALGAAVDDAVFQTAPARGGSRWSPIDDRKLAAAPLED